MQLNRQIINGDKQLILNESFFCNPSQPLDIIIPVQATDDGDKTLTVGITFEFGTDSSSQAQYNAKDDSIHFIIPVHNPSTSLQGFVEPAQIGIGLNIYYISIGWQSLHSQQVLVSLTIYGRKL
jgi:hypothetical protein